MKKTVITALVVLASGGVAAQSSVTVFGILDASYVQANGSIASASGLTSGGSGASRLGFRGIEDLGGGLKAGFVLEIGLSVDSGSGIINPSTDNFSAPVVGALTFGRRSTVSVSGQFGEVRVGRDITPTFYNFVQNPFGISGVGANTWIGLVGSNVVGQTQLRASNQIQYFLPSGLNGIYGHVTYAPSEQPSNAPNGSSNDGRYIGFRVGYANGPVNVALASIKTTLTRGTGLGNDRTNTNIAASYDFKVVKIFVEYDEAQVENTVGSGFNASGGFNGATAALGSASPGSDTTGKGYLLAATVPVGPGYIRAGYNRYQVKNALGLGTEPTAGKLAAGYVYTLSRRTSVYGTVARLSNSNGGTFTPSNNRTTGVSGVVNAANASSSAYEIGLRHTF